MTAVMGQAVEYLEDRKPMRSTPTPEEILRALTPENCRLVALICRHRPQSISALSKLAVRPQPNVSRSLATLEHAGIVSLVGARPKRPELAVTELKIELRNLRC
jgi:predicted transcriptional regulator